MTWKEARWLTRTAFTEVSLQAIYAFSQGNILPAGTGGDIVARARRRVAQSKAMVAGLLGFLSLGAAFILHYSATVSAHAFSYPIPTPVFQLGVLTALLGLDVAFLWWTGLQVLPTLMASSVLPLLETLPVDERTLRRVAALLYLRLFDLPALTILVLTPLLVGFALGLPAGLALVPGVFAAVAFALVLALLTARFFVARVQGARSGGGSTVLRWTYLVLWVIPAFGLFGFLTLAPVFFGALRAAAASAPSASFDLLLLAFPFPFAALPPAAATGTGALPVDPTGWGLLAGAAAAYVALALWGLSWLGSAVRRVGQAPSGVGTVLPASRFGLHLTGPVRSVLVKDLRIASRTPGYAFLILLPILDAFALGLLSYLPSSSGTSADPLALAAVTSAALLATFFGPAFFAIEVLAYSYGRTLPLPDRSLVLGKVGLVVAIYLVSAGVVLGMVDLRLYAPFIFLGFIFAELPAVAAACILELSLVLRRARRSGLPFVNLYSGSWTAIVIAIPGLIVAALPLVALLRAGGPSSPFALGIMALVAVAELGLAIPLLVGRGGS
jgi:Membrane protein of 12 TMs